MTDEPKKSRWEQYKERNGVTPLDLLNPQTRRINVELANERLATCRACPQLIAVVDQCRECGCFMKWKTTFEAAKCPLDKW